MNRRELLKSGLVAALLRGESEVIDYREIDAKFRDLSMAEVVDNAGGVASVTANKTSIYLFDPKYTPLSRIVNISVSCIDNIDDFEVDGGILLRAISDYKESVREMRMNKTAYGQLFEWWYRQKDVEKPESFESFGGVQIVIDERIRNDQKSVF